MKQDANLISFFFIGFGGIEFMKTMKKKANIFRIQKVLYLVYFVFSQLKSEKKERNRETLSYIYSSM